MTELLRGSLTTTFTPPSACSSEFSRIYFVLSTNGWHFAQGPVSLGSCFPSGFGAEESEFYSPGLCPTGYSTACSRLNRIGSVVETIFTCCPTSYLYTCLITTSGQPGGFGGCHSDLEPNTTLTSVYVLTGGSTLVLPTTSLDVGGIGAHSMQVRVQSTDFVATTSGTVSSGIGLTTSAATTSVTDVDTESTAESLSTGAAVGIAVAATVVIMGIMAATLMLFINKRQARCQPPIQILPVGEDSYANDQWRPPAELPQATGLRRHHEMDGNSLEPRELPPASY